MAYVTSSEYKQKIYDEDSEQIFNIYINNQLVNPSYIKNVDFDDNVFENDYFSLGSTVISKFEIELNNEIFNDFDSFSEMKLESTLILDDGEEIIPYGNYIIKEIKSASDYTTKFILYDYMDKFNVEFDASGLVPCTRYQLLQSICEYCGIELDNESILNGDVLVNVYDNSYIAKTYISFIAERAGGFAKITRDNKLVIKTFSDVDTNILPTDMGGEYTTNALKTITGVCYKNATQFFQSGDNTGEVVYLSQDNIFSCTQEEVDNIYNALNGLQFQSLNLKIWGDPSIDTGDIIQLENIKSFAQKSWTWGNGWYGEYKTTLNKVQNSLNVNKISAKQQFRRLESKIDEESGKIEILAGKTQTLEDKTGNMYTKEEVNKYVQTNSYSRWEIDTKLVDGTVENVNTKNGMTFDKTGLNFDKDGEPTKTNYNHAGQKTVDKSGAVEKILSYNGYVTPEVAQEESALERYKGQSANYNSNIIFNEYLSSNNGRWEDVEDNTYGKGIGFFIY